MENDLHVLLTREVSAVQLTVSTRGGFSFASKAKLCPRLNPHHAGLLGQRRPQKNRTNVGHVCKISLLPLPVALNVYLTLLSSLHLR